MISRILFPAIVHLFVTFSSFGNESCHVRTRRRPWQMSVSIIRSTRKFFLGEGNGSVRYVFNKKNHIKTLFDQGKGAFNVRQVQGILK